MPSVPLPHHYYSFAPLLFCLPQRCSGVPASILISVLSQLPQLRVLRLKGAPSSAILEILTFLPLLETLDTEYFGPAGFSRYDDVPAANLRELTVRTSSVHLQGPQQLWTWILRVVPRPSLVSFTLNAFSTQGEALVPRGFILDMAATHRDTLRHFTADSTQMTMKDLECLCTMFPMLETLSCSTLWTPEGVSLSPITRISYICVQMDMLIDAPPHCSAFIWRIGAVRPGRGESGQPARAKDQLE